MYILLLALAILIICGQLFVVLHDQNKTEKHLFEGLDKGMGKPL